MSKSKSIKVQREKQGFKERFSDLLEDMWDKIGQHHHGISGHVAGDVAADLSDANDAYVYSLDLPGLDEDDVEVSVQSGRLTIRGEKRDDRQEKGENYVFRERRFGRFERSFTLPAKVKEKDIEASFNKGVLEIKIPYKANKEETARKIEIGGG